MSAMDVLTLASSSCTSRALSLWLSSSLDRTSAMYLFSTSARRVSLRLDLVSDLARRSDRYDSVLSDLSFIWDSCRSALLFRIALCASCADSR